MTHDKLTIEVSSEDISLEVGYALLGRAMTLHHDPCDDNEDTAQELKEKAWEIIDEYEDETNTVSKEEASEILAEATDTPVEEIERAADEIDVGPLEEAEFVEETSPPDSDPATMSEILAEETGRPVEEFELPDHFEIPELDDLVEIPAEDYYDGTYRVVARVPYSNKPVETNVYELDRDELNQYFQDYHMTGEIVIDIRPVTDDVVDED